MKKLFRTKAGKTQQDDSVEEPVMLDAEVSVPETINPKGIYAISLVEGLHYIPGGSVYENAYYFLDMETCTAFSCTSPAPETQHNRGQHLAAYLLGEETPQHEQGNVQGILRFEARELPEQEATELRESIQKMKRLKPQEERIVSEYIGVAEKVADFFSVTPEKVKIEKFADHYMASSISRGTTVFSSKSKDEVFEYLMRPHREIGFAKAVKYEIVNAFEKI